MAINAYREVLLQQKRPLNGDGSLVDYPIVNIIGMFSGRFAIFDAYGDQIPELHIDGSDGYYVFSYKDGNVNLLAFFVCDTFTILRNGAVFMKQAGFAPSSMTYAYCEMTRDAGVMFSIYFTEPRDYRYWNYYVYNEEVGEDEYYRLVSPILEYAEENADMSPAWINYSEWHLEHEDEYVPVEEIEGYEIPADWYASGS
jgi:hypothetical protein